MKRPSALKKPSASVKKDVAVCPLCSPMITVPSAAKKLFIRQEKIVGAILIGSESVADVTTVSKHAAALCGIIW